jgi:hypothetical protein
LVKQKSKKAAQHALAADGSTGREKSRVQFRFPRSTAKNKVIVQYCKREHYLAKKHWRFRSARLKRLPLGAYRGYNL